jgi:hypothetical protein
MRGREKWTEERKNGWMSRTPTADVQLEVEDGAGIREERAAAGER